MKYVFIFNTNEEVNKQWNKCISAVNKFIKKHVECVKENNKKKYIKFKDGDEMYFMDVKEFPNFKVGRSPDSYICKWYIDLNSYMTSMIDYYQHKDKQDKSSNISPGDEVLVKMKVVKVGKNGIEVCSNVIENFMVPIEDVVKQ